MAKFFCVESPFVDHCLIEAVERIPDGIRARVALRPQLMNSWGGAHGGLIATLLDASMTVAARYALNPEGKRAVASIDITLTFIGQAKEEVVSEARLTAVRGSMVYVEARANNESGELVARASGTFKAIGKQES
jgi:uncharacterized protein (TIGR00369 family)